MIDNKTGGFFRLVIRMMVAEAPSSISGPCADKLAHFATLLGRFYQIRDDYQNLVSDEVSSQYYANEVPLIASCGVPNLQLSCIFSQYILTMV